MIRIGVAGFGAMGRIHGGNLRKGLVEGAALCAVYDPSPQALEDARTLYPDVSCFDEYEAMLDAVDAVILAGPHALHEPQALSALKKGRHVLTEKPLGVRASLAQQAVDEAAAKGLVYCVMFNQRAMAVNRKIKQLLDEKAIGPIRRAILICTDCYRPQSYFDAGSWRATWKLEGGGMLVNQLSHSLDQLCWWLGMPQRVCAHVGYGKWHDIEVDDDISCFAEYPDGGTLHIIASTADVPGSNVLEIQGDAGKIEVDRDGGSLKLYRLATPESVFTKEFEGGIGAPEITCEEMRFEQPDRGHLSVLRNFAAAIRGEEAPLAPACEAIGALRLTQSIYLSSWIGQSVEAPVKDDAFDAEFLKREAVSKPRVAKPVKIDFNAVWKK